MNINFFYIPYLCKYNTGVKYREKVRPYYTCPILQKSYIIYNLTFDISLFLLKNRITVEQISFLFVFIEISLLRCHLTTYLYLICILYNAKHNYVYFLLSLTRKKTLNDM